MTARSVEIRFFGSTRQLEEALARAGVAADVAGKEIGDKLGSGSQKAGGILSKLSQSLSNWGLPFSGSVDKMGSKLSEVEGKGKKFGSALSEVGKAATLGLAAGLGLVAVEGIKSAAAFDTLTERLVTTAGESQSKLGMVKAGILGISVSTDTAATTLATAMYTVESAGYHGAAGLAVLKAAAEGAKAEGASTATVADALTSALNAYGLSGKAAIPVTNQLLAAVSVGKMNFQDFAGSLSAVLPVAAAAHLSLAQVGGAVATMTAQGMSAQQATQDLANTIRSLQAPNSVAVGEMEQLGLNANDVAKNLGKRGLTGTLGLLTQTITSQMGPSGTVLLKAFNQSEAAGKDLQIMLGAMPAPMKRLAQAFMSGKETMTQFRKALPTNEQGPIQQFAALYAKANGFNAALKAGVPGAQTYTAALGKMVGGATGLNTTLLLTGSHLATFRSNVATVAAAAHHGGTNISHWKDIQGEFNFQLGQAAKAGEALATTIGEKLIPIIQGAIGFFQQHAEVAKVLAGIFAGVLAAAIAAYAAHLAVAGAKSIAEFAKMGAGAAKFAASHAAAMAKVVAKTAAWVAENAAKAASVVATNVASAASSAASWVASAATQVASAVATAATWIAKVAVMVASSVAGAVATAAAWVIANAAMLAGFALVVVAIAAGVALIIKYHKDIEKAAKAVWRAIQAAVSKVWDWIKSATAAVVNFIKKHWELLLAILLGPIALAVLGIKTYWATIKTDASKLIDDITGFFEKLPGKILGFLAELPGDFLKLGENMVKMLLSAFSHIGSDLGNLVKSAVSSIPGVGGLLSHIPGLAVGGIVTKPTLAMVGEAGPEAVVPLAALAKYTSGIRPLTAPGGLGGGSTGTGMPALNIYHNEQIHGGADPATVAQWKALQDAHDRELVTMLGQVAAS